MSKTVGAFVNTYRWLRSPYGFIQKKAPPHDEHFEIQTLIGPVLVLNSPEDIRVLADASQFNARNGNEVLRPFLGERSLLLLDGEEHASERRKLTPHFSRSRIRGYGPLIENITQKMSKDLSAGQVVSGYGLAKQISMEIIIRIVFGFDQQARIEKTIELMGRVTDQVWSALPFVPLLRKDLGAWSPGGKFRRLKTEVREFISKEIDLARQMQTNDRTDVLISLQRGQNRNNDLDEELLHDQLITLLLAGHETTAAGIAWALEWIHYTPGVLERINSELNTTANKAGPVDFADSRYLDAACKEALRIYPVIPFIVRTANQPVSLSACKVPAGARVAASIYLTHHRRDIYSDPECYLPERFLEHSYSPFEYLPFGIGPHRCLGAELALYEMKVVLAVLLGRWNFQLAGARRPVPDRASLAIKPSGNTPLLVLGAR